MIFVDFVVVVFSCVGLYWGGAFVRGVAVAALAVVWLSPLRPEPHLAVAVAAAIAWRLSRARGSLRLLRGGLAARTQHSPGCEPIPSPKHGPINAGHAMSNPARAPRRRGC